MHAASFRDDPTRLWRLVRYAVRLGFTPEPATDRLAFEAVQRGALETVSGDRLGAELRLALIEPDPLAALHAAQNLGLVDGLTLDPGLVARRAGAAAARAAAGARALGGVDTPDAAPRAVATSVAAPRPDLTILGAVIPDGAWARPFGFTAIEQRILERCAALEPIVAARPSEVVAALRGEPVEAVAVAGARGDAETAAAVPDAVAPRHAGDRRPRPDRRRARRGAGAGRAAGRCPRAAARRRAGARPRGRAGRRAGDAARIAGCPHAVGERLLEQRLVADAADIELDLPGAHVRFTTRAGGVSEGPYASLNLGRWTEDDPDAVAENRRRAADGRPLAFGRQVHGTRVLTVDGATPDDAIADADGVATAAHGRRRRWC